MAVTDIKMGTTSSAERSHQNKRISWGDNESYKVPSAKYKAVYESKAEEDIDAYLATEGCDTCPSKNGADLDFNHNTDPSYNKAMAVDIGYMLPKIKRLREDCTILCTFCKQHNQPCR